MGWETPPKYVKETNHDGLLKSPKTVMPDSIRHPELIEIAGFLLSPE